MKKITLTIVTIFLFGYVNAQQKSEMSFGIKGGLNIASISNIDQDGVNSKSLIGFHAGFFAEFMISDNFALQPELLYSAQGVKLDSFGDDGDLKLDYIVIPVMAKYYVADTFSLEFGPQIGFLVSAEAKSGGVSEDVKNDFESTDVGLGFGANYDFAEKFMLGARYNLGLTRLQKDVFPGESEWKNSVFQISLGYKF
ncbi:opacity protein-like surface antigen [Flavobacterium sp. CG_23.5]|uniref:porin family protein n=1 Tax=unclassified Flavobacterium TaxID=196869 RepID=UPI0018CA975A|nr:MULTISPECIES: porin family protein [unclassified Flavobacterium]MBG6110713.1 opacity protein-like surface antigen [Flavobacterium sp. CG_9.10]MBP2282884.1 opacity protein-like surface antigen [Flavobacterium sp. CG_23.5]